MINPHSETFLSIENTITVSQVTPFQRELLVLYFAEDLERLVQEGHINLAEALGFPPGYPSSNKEVILQLYDDLAHLMRDERIVGIHLLLSDRHIDLNLGGYPVRCHFQYTIKSDRAIDRKTYSEYNRSLPSLPAEVWQDARFDLLIDWSPLTLRSGYRALRPEYCFDWIPPDKSFDITNLIHYHHGYLALERAYLVERSEFRSPEYLPNQESVPDSGRGNLPDSKMLKAEDIPLPLYALARVVLEDDDKALVGKMYTVQAGVSRTQPEGFIGEVFAIQPHNITVPLTFDLLIHTSEHIELTTDWHKKLLFDPLERQPQLVEFTFLVVARGRGSLSIDLYYERRWLRTVRIEFDSVELLQGSIASSEV